MTTRANDTALADILVVEIGGRVGAGVCGGMLAQLGAETVLVEMPPAGAFAGGKARWRDQFAAGKLSFRPDADNPDDVDLLRRLVAAAQKVYDISQARYKSGIDSFLSVLDAQRELYVFQQNEIQIERQRLANLVNLYKVLGGGSEI